MLNQVTMSALAVLSPEAREQELGGLVAATKTANGSASAYLQGRIRQFELRYEMSSDEMLQALDTGRQKETAEIAEWLFYLDALQVHGGETRA